MVLRRWLSSLVLGGSILMALSASVPTTTLAQTQTDPATLQTAISVMQQSRCGACHIIPGVPNANGNFGPDLGPHDDVPPVAGRTLIAIFPRGSVPNNSLDDLAAWIENPAALKPGTAMPNMGVSHDDALTVAAYLYAVQPDGSVAGLDSGAPVTLDVPAPTDTGEASPPPDSLDSSSPPADTGSYNTGDGSSGDGG
jgi:cytochrome c2